MVGAAQPQKKVGKQKGVKKEFVGVKFFKIKLVCTVETLGAKGKRNRAFQMLRLG